MKHNTSKKNKKEIFEYNFKELSKRLDALEKKISDWENSLFWRKLSTLDVKGFWSKNV